MQRNAAPNWRLSRFLLTSDSTKALGQIVSRFPRGICSISRVSAGMAVTILDPRSIRRTLLSSAWRFSTVTGRRTACDISEQQHIAVCICGFNTTPTSSCGTFRVRVQGHEVADVCIGSEQEEFIMHCEGGAPRDDLQVVNIEQTPALTQSHHSLL